MTKKTALEQALLESKEILAIVTENAKHMLMDQMKPEIDQKITEGFEDLAKDKDDESPEVAPAIDAEPETDSTEVVTDEPTSDVEPEVAIDEPELDGSDDISAVEPIGDTDPEMGGDTLDMTGASDDELISVWKKLGDDAELQVVKNADNTVNVTTPEGSEFMIKINENQDLAIEEEFALFESQFGTVEEDKYSFLENISGEQENETIIEIVMDEDDNQLPSPPSEIHLDANAPSTGVVNTPRQDLPPAPKGDPLANTVMQEDESIEEVARTHADGRNMTRKPEGFYKYAQSRLRPAVNESSAQEDKGLINEAKTLKVEKAQLITENETLKNDLEKHKDTLRILKENLEQVAIFNSKLAYTNRLFCEEATTNDEKRAILERFDEVKTSKDVQALYKTISAEMKSTTIKESVESKIVSNSLSGTTGETLLESANPAKAELQAQVDRLKYMFNYGKK